MDALHPTQTQAQIQRPVGPPAVGPEVASPDIHVITHIDATEPVIEPFATLGLQQLEEMKKAGGAHVTADATIDRLTVAPAVKIAKGALTTAFMLAPMGLGIAAGIAAGSFLVGAAGLHIGFKLTKSLAMKGFLQKGLGGIMSGIKESKMAEPRWDGRRTYEIEADKTAAVDSKIVSQGDLPKVRYPQDITNFLASNMKKYPSGTTVVHMVGHGLGYRYSAGLPFNAYTRVLADTTAQAGRPTDVLLLESCLQGNLEALSASSAYARYAVLSEETVTAGVVGDLLTNAVTHTAGQSLTPRDFGKQLIKEADAIGQPTSLKDMKPGAETLTLIDMTKVPALVSAVDKLGTVLADEVGDGRTEFIRGAVDGTEEYPKPGIMKRTRDLLAIGDLKDFCERLQAVYNGNQVEMPKKHVFGPIYSQVEKRFGQAPFSPRARDIEAAAGDVLLALDQATVALHTSKEYHKAGGVSIQLPGNLAKLEGTKHFQESGLTKFHDSACPAGWQKFVDAMAGK